MSYTGHLSSLPENYRSPVPLLTAVDSSYLAGDSIAMRRIRSQLQRIAPYFRIALVTGEKGTGKETVARALHARSEAAGGPFVVWQPSEFEEKLGQAHQRSDLLREAHCGTLFLDGIDHLPLPLQATLLRVLQQHHGSRSPRYDLRIVAASNRELRALATTGQFREELYRRFAAVEIALVPLRLRREDIAAVASALLRQTAGTATLSSEIVAHLECHDWPGNIRELANVLETSTASARGEPVQPHHLPPLHHPEELAQVPEHRLEKLQDVVQRHVLHVLTRCAGNKLRASEVLGISRSTLYRMLDAGAAGANPGLNH